jgi:hypothetical protein
MAIKQDMTQQIEAQLKVWQGQIKDYQERLGQAGAQSKADHEKAVAQMQENADQAKRLLQQVQEANEAAWKDMQQASQQSLERLQKGWADALSRFG